jgi:hypothetical protein
MKVIKAVYNEKTRFITDIVDSFEKECIIEKFNMDHHKQAKDGRPILTRHGTTNVPLVVFEDENLDEVAAIWSEEEPSWEVWITHTLKEIS